MLNQAVFSGSLQLGHNSNIQNRLSQLEKDFNGRIGLYAIDTNTGNVIAYRANQIFPVQSTFKLLAVAAILKKHTDGNQLIQKRIYYKPSDVVEWSPITKLHVWDGMTIKRLARAAMSYSDNTAINLIIKQLGGLKSVTDFSRSIGNHSFNLKHYEANLNSNPNNCSDTSTPKDMATSLKKLTLGSVLDKKHKALLFKWMRGNTTGYHRIRAGTPPGWDVADKTGSGSYGVANDVAVISSPTCKPIVLAVYTVRKNADAKWRDDVVAEATRLVFNQSILLK